MDPELLKQRALFQKRALANPVVEKRKLLKEKAAEESKHKKSKIISKPKADVKSFDYKTSSGSSQFKFGVLAKVVKYMRIRHQKGETHPLTVEDILDETNQMDVGPRIKHWLSTEALKNNPKIAVVDSDTYLFKPKYPIRDRKGLLRLLDKHDQQGRGGICLDDIEEALPNYAKALKVLGDQVLRITRPVDKKEILFYNDKTYNFVVDDEFQKLWRSVPVDGIDENKIKEYLEKQGITSMQDSGLKKCAPQKRKGGNRKKGNTKRDNAHIANILEDYSEK